MKIPEIFILEFIGNILIYFLKLPELELIKSGGQANC